MKYWRHHRIRGWREYGAIAAFACVALIGAGFLVVLLLLPAPKQNVGVTFSSMYSESLGLNAEDALQNILSDLQVDHLRLPVYWSAVETVPGEYDFSSFDALVEIAERHNVPVTVAIGVKVPRWPECFIPEFYDGEAEDFDAHVLRYVQAAVTHIRQYDIVSRWQVENEPFFPYGTCPSVSLSRLQQEVQLVRALDSRPILMTVSGEQEPWLDVTSMSDQVGFSVYRFAFQDVFGPVVFPQSSMYYRLQAFVTGIFSKEVILSELQMEPWFNGDPTLDSSIVVPFTQKDFTSHLAFARRTGVREVLLWGVEWWYYEHLRGNNELWNTAQSALHSEF